MDKGAHRRRNMRVLFETAVCVRAFDRDEPPVCSDQTRDRSLKGLYF